jgi:hypothetical protein
LWLFDAAEKRPTELPVRGKRDISAASFTKDNRLLLSDRFTRVTEYQLDPFEITRSIDPPANTLELAYRYAVKPIYTVFPKPGELDNLVAYLLTEENSMQMDGRTRTTDLRADQVVLDIWQPAWSSLIFVAVILSLTCVSIARRDF